MATVQLAELKEELADLIVDRVTIVDLGELGSKDAKLQHHAKDLESRFSTTENHALVFVGRVEAIIEHCNEIVKIQGELTKGNFRCVENFLAEFKAKMADCEKTYQLFNENRKKVQISSTKAAMECNKQAEKADTKKIKTRAVGGSVAAGLLATGVGGVGIAASVAAGAFTFGIGTPITLAITGAVLTGLAGSAGVATAVATGVIASKYDKFSKKLREIKKSFDKLHKSACSLVKNLNDLKVQVDSLVYEVKYLERKYLERKYLEKANSTSTEKNEKGHLSWSWCCCLQFLGFFVFFIDKMNSYY